MTCIQHACDDMIYAQQVSPQHALTTANVRKGVHVILNKLQQIQEASNFECPHVNTEMQMDLRKYDVMQVLELTYKSLCRPSLTQGTST